MSLRRRVYGIATLCPAISEDREKARMAGVAKEQEGGRGEGTTVFGSADMGVRCHPQRNKKGGKRLTGLTQGRMGLNFAFKRQIRLFLAEQVRGVRLKAEAQVGDHSSNSGPDDGRWD